MVRFASKLTDAQFRLARRFEAAGLCSLSQAVKAFERHDEEQVEEWKRQLAAKERRDDA